MITEVPETDLVVELVEVIESALAIVGNRAKDELKIRLQSAELEVRVAFTKGTEVEAKVELVPIEYVRTEVRVHSHTISISLTPRSEIKLGPTTSNDLADSIFALASVMDQVSKGGRALFTPDAGCLCIEITRSKEQKWKVGVGPVEGNDQSHLIRLTFRPTV